MRNATFFSVMTQSESFPAVIRNLATQAKEQRFFRIQGGCSGMTDEQAEKVIPYFLKALKGFAGIAMSGGTLASSGKLMVTNVPAALADDGNDCIALGSLPRTADMTQPRGKQITVSQYGDSIDPGQHAVAVVQKNASEVLDWDGDLQAYFDFAVGLRDDAGWTVAAIVFNGGGVTKKELLGALERGIPVVVVRGSGRAADEFAAQYDGGSGSFPEEAIESARASGLVSFADFGDPMTLRACAVAIGLLDD